MKWYHLDVRDMTKAQYDEYYAMADKDRRRKADACRNEEDRLCSIAGDHLARLAISEHCGVPMEAIRFARSGDGKPYALDLDVHFNISHSGSLAACAVSDKPVGIDVQVMRLVRKALARKVCTRRELSYLKDAEGFGELLTGRALVRFYRVWCSKEAYFKWLGTGITDLKSFDTVDHIFSGGTFQIDEYMVSIYE